MPFQFFKTGLLMSAAVMSVACSSDSGGDSDPVVTDAFVSSSGSAEVDQPATDNQGVAGEGMPYLYDTGYHVDTIKITRAGSAPEVIQLVTDTENNVVQEVGGPRNFDDFWYDEQGRITSFSRLGVSLTYNNDGTIRSTSSRSAADGSTTFNEYAYAEGKLQSSGVRLVSENVESILGGAIYNYSLDGTLSNSRTLTSESREITDLGYEYVVNSDGLITSAQKVPVGEFDIQFTPEYLFFTFNYDENKNITKVENYTNEGELIKTVDFTYLANTEPTPNIAGFMLITESQFREVFETY